MMSRATLSLAAMALTLVATSGPALAHVGGNCAAGTCSSNPDGDLIVATPDSNRRHGLGGNDLIRGLGGNDFLTGDDGNDAVHGGSGDDRVEGNAGGDLIKGGRGGDLIKGGRGDDRMVGGSGGDLLRGGSGAERIEARDGFADVISCGAGSEDLVLADALDSVAADCESPVVSQAKPGCGSRNYVGPVPAGQTLYGTSCSDIIKGGGGNDTLWGLPSGDDLDGGRGANDVCNGGKGNDDFSRCDGNAHE